MKAALVCTEKLPVPPVRGGAIQLYIDGVLPFLSRKHEITVFGVEDPSLPARESGPHAEMIRLPAATQAEYLARVAGCIEPGRFDVVHVFNRPKWIPSLRRCSPGSALVLNLHNEMFDPGKIGRSEAEAVIAALDGMAAVSDFVKRSVTALYPEAAAKCRVIYSGVDTSTYQPAWQSQAASEQRATVRSMLGLGDSWVLLFVGRLSDKKGAHIVLRAMQDVVRRNSRIRLVVVGSRWYGGNTMDDYVRHLDREAERLGGSVVLTGFVPPREVPQYYAAADAFVCASQWAEPLSRTIYEAMASGLPIITTSRGGNAEVVRGTGAGLVIDDYANPAEFAHHICYLHDNPDHAAAMGRAGRRLAEERYTWSRVASELDELYARAAAACSNRSRRAVAGVSAG